MLYFRVGKRASFSWGDLAWKNVRYIDLVLVVLVCFLVCDLRSSVGVPNWIASVGGTV